MTPTRTPTRRTSSGRSPAGRAPRRPASRRRKRSTGARRTRRAGRLATRWWPGLLVAAAVLAGVAWRGGDPAGPVLSGTCAVQGSPMTLTGEQVTNAATIARVGYARGLPDRAVVIALATAQQESRLRNLDHGDRDSLGLFQQRPSQGWGTPAQVRDPTYAAARFYERLVGVPDWQTRRLTEVAQAVQRSGFPEAYQRWEPMAQALTRSLHDRGDRTLPCR
ncbi:MAG: hypothetical protein JWQ45_974 [Blastococcus sp.]|nr:hypothetical protein [Blastococcus sp.]